MTRVSLCGGCLCEWCQHNLRDNCGQCHVCPHKLCHKLEAEMAEDGVYTYTKLRKVVLERFEHYISKLIPGDIVRQMVGAGKLDVFVIDDVLDRMIVRLRACVFGETLEEIAYPADWWQAFRERWFPRFVLRRFPVRQKTITARAYYPSVSIPWHDPRVTLMVADLRKGGGAGGASDPGNVSGVRPDVRD